MSKDPAVLFYTSDFLSGTMLMNYAEKGQYITLLCLQHQTGHLSKDDIEGITSSEKVKSKFVLADDGKYHNIRMHNESNKRKAYSESRSKNRKSNPKKTSKRSDKHMSNICQTYEKHMENENEDVNTIKDIIEDLNVVCEKTFKETTGNTVKLIKSRLKEGFTLEDFKTVHRNKAIDWKNNKEYSKFLRPETLYGNKFESYLNEKKKEQIITSNKTIDQIIEEDQQKRIELLKQQVGEL